MHLHRHTYSKPSLTLQILMTYIMETCILSPEEGESQQWLLKKIYITTTWVIYIHRNWLEEDSLAVLACLSMSFPGLQGHSFRVQALWAKQLTNVRRQDDVHTALGAQMLPSHTQKKCCINSRTRLMISMSLYSSVSAILLICTVLLYHPSFLYL